MSAAKADWMPQTEAASWEAQLLRSRTGMIQRVLANAALPLRLADEFRGALRWNELTLRPEAERPLPWAHRGAIDDQQVSRFAEWLQKEGVLVPVEIAGQALAMVARERVYHPIREYLDNLAPWDGTRRLHTWLAVYLSVDHGEYARDVGRCFFIGMVARILKPGCKADHVLVLEGPQGVGKSRALAIIGGEWFTDEIADLGTKDAAMQLAGAWLVEFAEWDATSRAESSRLKAFITRTSDRYRPPYGRTVIEQPRQCVFAGTVNLDAYLRDESGARRFWPVRVGEIRLAELERDRDQLFAEALVALHAGEPWWLTSGAVVAEAGQEQAARYESDAWDGIIQRWLEGRDSVTSADILKDAIGKALDTWTRSDEMRVGRALRVLGWVRRRVRGSGGGLEYRYSKAETE